MAQQTLNKKTKEEARRVLDTIRDMNLENISFSDKQNLIAKLGIKVYPSENIDHIGVTCVVNLAGLEDKGKLFSCHNTNIASPKL